MHLYLRPTAAKAIVHPYFVERLDDEDVIQQERKVSILLSDFTFY
jgi:hypothetical protein